MSFEKNNKKTPSFESIKNEFKNRMFTKPPLPSRANNS